MHTVGCKTLALRFENKQVDSTSYISRSKVLYYLPSTGVKEKYQAKLIFLNSTCQQSKYVSISVSQHHLANLSITMNSSAYVNWLTMTSLMAKTTLRGITPYYITLKLTNTIRGAVAKFLSESNTFHIKSKAKFSPVKILLLDPPQPYPPCDNSGDR